MVMVVSGIWTAGAAVVVVAGRAAAALEEGRVLEMGATVMVREVGRALEGVSGEAGALLMEAGPALDELAGETGALLTEAGALLTEAGPALDEVSGEAEALLETGAAGLLDTGVDEAGAGVGGQRVMVLGMAVIKGFCFMWGAQIPAR